ncbi:MAG: hypothetical protein M1358_25085, partial [Chloroflexi bacterium]|nr:hypothetical protein [Chloroflexota bacterium]
FELTMWLFSLAGRTEMPALGEAVAMDWQKIGVKANLVRNEWVNLVPKVNERELRSNAWSYGVPWETEPLVVLQRNAVTAPGNTNVLGFAFPDLDKLIDQAAAEPDAAKRASIQKKIGQLIYDNYWWAPIAVTNSVWAYGKRVDGWPQARGSTYLTNLEYVTPAS